MSKFIGNSNQLIYPMEEIPKVKSGFIKSDSNNTNLINPIHYEAKEKSPEEKIYIILYNLNDVDEDDPTSKTFSVCIGRTLAYNDIKNKLLSGMAIDVHRSYVMTETRQTETKSGDIKYYMIPYEECISIYAFFVSISNFYSDDEFDIEDYADGDVPEDDRLNKANTVLSADQLEYRRMLEESLQRDKFITNMRQIYANDSSNNV